MVIILIIVIMKFKFFVFKYYVHDVIGVVIEGCLVQRSY